MKTNPTPRALVPVTPTDEMVAAGYRSEPLQFSHQCDNKRELERNEVVPIYAAAIKAAPYSGAVSKEDVEVAAEALYQHAPEAFLARTATGTHWIEVSWDDADPVSRSRALTQARAAFRAIGLTVEE